MIEKLLQKIPSELVVFIVTTIFMAGMAYNGSNSQAEDIKILKTHDQQYGEAIAVIRQRLDDIMDHFGIPKTPVQFHTDM